MTSVRLKEILGRIGGAAIGVVGDFCLDAYWEIDDGERELSLETGKPTHGVRSQRYAPGGAGNVAANIAALGTGHVRAFSVVGNDLFGREMASILSGRGIDTSGLLVQDALWDTPVYAKPHLGDTEQERIDFGRWNAMHSEAALTRLIRSALPALDAVVVNQQLARGIHTEAMIRALNDCAREHPGVPFIVDARTMSASFTGMTVKLNAREAARIGAGEAPSHPEGDVRSHARSIAVRSGKPVFVTRGAEGILLYDGKDFTDIPALVSGGPVDTVGAGDATVAAIAAALASGGTLAEAAALGCYAASVTVRKLKETGTATGPEILDVARNAGVLT